MLGEVGVMIIRANILSLKKILGSFFVKHLIVAVNELMEYGGKSLAKHTMLKI